MVTNLEKHIYNTYLRISRSSRDKPVSYRKNFDDLDESTEYNLHRISLLLQKYPHIDPEDYFKAPFVVYPNAEFFSIEYFAGMGAVAAYTTYMKQIQEMSPDSEEQLQFIKKSLHFIGTYCIKNNIQIEQYPKSKTGVTYDWMKHIKAHQISVYVLMEFPEISNIIKGAEEDEKELFLGEIGRYFWGYKTKYNQSSVAKILVPEGIQRIKKIINNKITS